MKQKTKKALRILYSIRMDVEKFVRVKAYKRIQKGKVVRVKSHYRRY